MSLSVRPVASTPPTGYMYTWLDLNVKDQHIISGMTCQLSFQDVLDSSMHHSIKSHAAGNQQSYQSR
jgi:hypothetical protein